MDKIEQIRELRKRGLSFEEAYKEVMKEEVCDGYRKLKKFMKGDDFNEDEDKTRTVGRVCQNRSPQE